MSTFFSFSLDLALIGLLIAAIVTAIKLSHQLTGLRQSRVDMERFIVEFNSTVSRAEAGVRGLKQAARSGGDDLEKLIDRAGVLRDEMIYLIEAADQSATRLTDSAAKPGQRTKPETTESQDSKTHGSPSLTSKHQAPKPAAEAPAPAAPQQAPTAASGAERELLRVLGKLR